MTGGMRYSIAFLVTLLSVACSEEYAGPPANRANLPSGRRPIILLGDSNAAQGYIHATNYPAELQATQYDIGWTYRMFCHQGEQRPPAWAINDTLVYLSPFVVGGIARGSWVLDLGLGLSQSGIPAVVLAYPVGGNTLDNYNPVVNPAGYTTVLNWIAARLMELRSHQAPLMIVYEGTNGEGAESWEVGMTHAMAGFRNDLGYPDLGVVVLRCPWTLESDGQFAATIAKQNAYVASDPHSALAYHDTCTYADNDTLVEGYPNGRHFDRAGGHAIAVGPDVAGTTKSILTALQDLIAAGL